MLTLNEIELSEQHRNEILQQAEHDRLARQLRAAGSATVAGKWNALLARFLAWSPRKRQAAEC